MSEDPTAQGLVQGTAHTESSDLVISLGLDFEVTLHQSFERDVIQDLSRASPPGTSFRLKSATPCIVVSVELQGCKEALEVGRKLEAQAREPSSKLRQGTITCRILGLAVKGFLSTPTEHGASQSQVSITQINGQDHVLT